MPGPGRSILLAAALAGAALGAGPAVGAKHHRKARLIATKARAHGHVPAHAASRPPLVGTLPVTGPATTPTTTDPVPTTPPPCSVLPETGIAAVAMGARLGWSNFPPDRRGRGNLRAWSGGR
jgi:hypothetical protein